MTFDIYVLCISFQKFSTGVTAVRQLYNKCVFLWDLPFHLASFLLFWKIIAFCFKKYIHIPSRTEDICALYFKTTFERTESLKELGYKIKSKIFCAT